MLVIVGCRTSAARQARGLGLRSARVTGEQWQALHTRNLTNPSYQIAHPNGRLVYSVHGDLGEVSVLGVDVHGHLSWRQHVSTGGRNPVHLCLSANERFILIANYASGSLSCFSLTPDGQLGRLTSVLSFTGTPGPDRTQQRGSHPHQVVRWPGTDLFLVPDKGLDRLHAVALDAAGQLALCARWEATPGAGPRHLALDATRQRIWLCNELAASVTALTFCPLTQAFRAGPTTAVLPQDCQLPRSAGGIALHPLGHTLYVSNRGHDSVCVLSANPSTGELHVRSWVPTQGRTPRFITLSPSGDALFVANEDSDSVVRLPLAADGNLDLGQPCLHTGSPVCLTFLSSCESTP